MPAGHRPSPLEHLRQSLQNRRQELRTDLSAAEQTRQADTWPDSQEVADQKDLAARRQTSAVDSAQEERDREEIEAVEAALRRVEDGSYGICLDCGEAIAPARLEVQPAAPRCARCQSAHELSAGRSALRQHP